VHGDDLLLLRSLAIRSTSQRIRFGCDHARQLIEKLPHVRRQHAAKFFERAFDVVLERRAGERPDQCPAEIERAQFRKRQARSQPLECLAVDLPSCLAVVAIAVVEQRKPSLFERLKIATDGPRCHLA
jgi:hypothetical protein